MKKEYRNVQNVYFYALTPGCPNVSIVYDRTHPESISPGTYDWEENWLNANIHCLPDEERARLILALANEVEPEEIEFTWHNIKNPEVSLYSPDE
jgi:hypothetical protein